MIRDAIPTRGCRVLFHVHTRASYDCLMSPRRVVERCREMGIAVVVICDHDRVDALADAEAAGLALGVRVVPAVEFATDHGDVIGLMVASLCPDASLAGVLDHIHGLGGLAVLPHPLRGHCLDRLPVERFDLIEVYNARCSARENELAMLLAERYGKPALAGADAHVPGELELVSNDFGDCPPGRPADWTAAELRHLFLCAPRSFRCERSPEVAVCASQVIKGFRQRAPGDAARSLKDFGRTALRRRFWRLLGAAR